MSSSMLGVFAVPSLENATFISQGIEPGNKNLFGIGNVKQCQDLNGRTIPQGVHFVPGPDQCTLCVCDDGGPKWCKAVLCSPPQDCKSFRVGNSCCDFICLDDSLKKGEGGNGFGKNGGPFGGIATVDMSDVIPKVVIASITVMMSLSLLLFLVHRLRKREIQGRRNSAAAARRSNGQTCDECDDTRSLDFSLYDFDRLPHSNSDLFPPQYLAWWKRPTAYFPPRGEAPPPYEEAIASTCLPNSFLTLNNNNINTTILTNENINQLQMTATILQPSAPAESVRSSQIIEGVEIQNGEMIMQPIPGPSFRVPAGVPAEQIKGVARNDVSTDPSPPSYSTVARDCFRHSLTLPRRPNYDEVREFGLDLDGSSNYFRRNRQRFSLQLNVNVDDSSSSSSTMSLSASITPIDHREDILSSSSGSSITNFP